MTAVDRLSHGSLPGRSDDMSARVSLTVASAFCNLDRASCREVVVRLNTSSLASVYVVAFLVCFWVGWAGGGLCSRPARASFPVESASQGERSAHACPAAPPARQAAPAAVLPCRCPSNARCPLHAQAHETEAKPGCYGPPLGIQRDVILKLHRESFGAIRRDVSLGRVALAADNNRRYACRAGSPTATSGRRRSSGARRRRR